MNAEMYRACAISVTDIESDDIRVVCAQAADELLSVSGVDASFVIFKTDDIINISARSMGKVNVQLIMEALGGGGHQTMAAVQLKDITESQIKDMLKPPLMIITVIYDFGSENGCRIKERIDKYGGHS